MAFCFTSCGPQSKEAYLIEYDTFINNVQQNQSQMTDKIWEEIDAEYVKFNGKWYDKFKDELDWQDKLLVKKHQMNYNFVKFKSGTNKFYDYFIKEDYEHLRDQVLYYYENDMDSDLDRLVETAKNLGDKSEKLLDSISKELGIKLKVGN